MRIESYNQIQQIYQKQRVNKSKSVSQASQSDMLQISSLGKDFQTAKAAVKNSPDIREDITAPIKAKIEKGTYDVDTASFAEKLMKKYAELG